MAEATPAIEFIDVEIPPSRQAGAPPVLHEVRWRIQRGEFWALGAAPGRGKTDLLCTAAALQRPVRGHHLLFGKDTRLMNEQDLVASHRKVAMVFDTGRLFPNLTVAENLVLPLAYHFGTHKREVSERVERVLEATGLADIRTRRPRELTRNLHQRVGLARALGLDPEVLLIDTPLQATDPRQSRWWVDFLCELNRGHALFEKRPLTIVVAADDLRPWADLASQFAVIKQKTVQVVGGRNELRGTRDTAVQELLTPEFEE